MMQFETVLLLLATLYQIQCKECSILTTALPRAEPKGRGMTDMAELQRITLISVMNGPL